MKKIFSILFALLAIVGVANAGNGGKVKAGVKYEFTTTNPNYDTEYDTEEVIPAGKAVVVFYYTSDASHPFLFGPGYVDPKYNNETGVVRMWADTTHRSYSKNADGTEHINPCGYVTAGEYWCYTICDEADIMTVKSPLEQGGGGDNNDDVKPIVIGKGADVKPNTLYALPLSDEEGYVNDNLVTLENAYTADQYLVVFMNAPGTATATDFKSIFYNSKDKEFTAGSGIEDGGEFTFKRYYRAGADSKLDIYAQDMNGTLYADGYTWSYVIVNSLDEAKTVANPFAKKGEDGPTVVPGQDEENAIVLTKGVEAKFKSTNKTVFVKFEAPASGTVTMTIAPESNWNRWMEEGVLAYGKLKQNTFTNGNQFNVEKGHTYYCRYDFAAEVEEGTVSFALAEAEKGAARGEAILLEANGQQDLLGIAHVDDDYFNKDTWFKLEKDGAFDGNDLVQVAIGGGNETMVSLYADDETDAIKSYAMGSGTGMLAKNSTVKFDIDLSQHDYYIKISQDDVNGTATFTVRKAAEGETMAHAFTAVEGENTVETAGWYKYTHAGDTKLIKLSGISAVYNEDGGNVAEGEDIKVGWAIEEGTSIFFQASTSGFTLTLEAMEKGMTADDPFILTNETGATFNLGTSVATDTQRFMQYEATEDGTFLYGTTNAKVIEFAVSATVRDITNPESPKNVSIVQEENNDFGETYFIYKWPVVAGHTYAIEQGLGNNFGTVEFLSMFTAAEPGETIGKAFAIELYEAKDLGRAAATPKYYKFTAAEAGTYTVSVQMKGYVKSYDAEGKGTSIAQSYSDGLVYHNGTFELAAGETLVFSCEPSETIEHIGVAIQDEFIPNYYATVTKADETGGLDYNQPMAINVDDETSIDLNNVWHGPIAVPAGETLYVVANTVADVNAIYFAVETTNGLQWINKNTELAVEKEDGKQIYTLAAADADRNIQIMSYGMKCEGTFTATFTDPKFTPADPLTFAVAPEYAYDYDTKELTVSFTVPATYKDSETAVENLNLAAVKIKNETTGEEMEITTGTGEGAYNAGDVFSVSNTLTFAVNEGDVLSISLETWGQDNITIEVATSSPIVMPIDENAYYMVISKNGESTIIKVTSDLKVEWKKGSELK